MEALSGDAALGAVGLLICAVILVSLLKRDSKEYGSGCAFGLFAVFVGTVLVAVVGMLAAYGRLP